MADDMKLPDPMFVASFASSTTTAVAPTSYVEELAYRTKGFTGADIAELVNRFVAHLLSHSCCA
jgi:SpoVK/Ycf46/Vps4 family AAA+-type ATPase